MSANQLATAIRIAACVHEKQLDKGGNPYILHPLRVMFFLDTSDFEVLAMAVLHDVIEDDPEWTRERLAAEGFSERVLIGLDCLTHREGETYEDYVKRIATNPDARKVKKCDLRDNMDLRRLKGIRQKDFERIEKYTRAFAYLDEVDNIDHKIYP